MLKRGTVRYAPAVILSAAVVAATLTGCSSAPASQDCLQPGKATDQVSVSGKLDSAPKVSIPTPLYAQYTQAETVIAGDGAELTGDEVVSISWTLLNGRTGEKLFSTDYENPKPAVQSGLIPGIAEALECQTVGSRVVAAIAPEDAFGEQGNAMLDVEPKDTLIAVIDIADSFRAKADGTNLPVVEQGLPSVVRAPDGTPGLTIPNSPAPTSEKSAQLKLGKGPTVSTDDTIVAHILQASWDTQSVTSSTWSDETPKTITISDAPEALKKALTDTTVGSQVIVVEPDGDDDATIYVIDVLGIL